MRGSLENVSRYHNPQLADPVQAQAFMEREFAPRAMGARYDWLYEYDALTVPVDRLRLLERDEQQQDPISGEAGSVDAGTGFEPVTFRL